MSSNLFVLLDRTSVFYRIVFTPKFSEVESAILDTYDIMIKAANDIPRFEHYLDPG